MGLETSVYIDGLVPSNPTGSDLKSLGDDHLRLIKQTIKNTFPNITGAVTLTQAALNQLGNVELFIKSGMILMWTGTVETIPVGWKLCNGAGSISTGAPVPNLIDRFPVGAGAKYAPLAVGGVETNAAAGTIAVTVQDTILTIAQIPSHKHDVISYAGLDGGLPQINSGVGGSSAGTQTRATGGGLGHNHPATATFTGTPVTNLPPYCGVYFIIKN